MIDNAEKQLYLMPPQTALFCHFEVKREVLRFLALLRNDKSVNCAEAEYKQNKRLFYLENHTDLIHMAVGWLFFGLLNNRAVVFLSFMIESPPESRKQQYIREH